MGREQHPFNYDLHYTEIPGQGDVWVVFHGMGGDYQMGEITKNMAGLEGTVVSFNFPDYSFHAGFDPGKVRYGTVYELLPAIYVLKKVVVDGDRDRVNIYGFSAGGGAIVNVLAALNSSIYDKQLQDVGVSESDKKKILDAVQKGIVVLDSPLKSMREILAAQGNPAELAYAVNRYKENAMEPIDAIEKLKGLKLNVIIYFNNPDPVLGNRDDAEFIERFKKVNSQGITEGVIGKNQGHLPPHPELWQRFKEKFN